jgi:hypothetical protein
MIGAVIGGIVGYELTALLCCLILFPGSNLCGLPAVFIGGPVGVVAGGFAGGYMSSYRFSLRTMFVAITVAAVVLGLIVWATNK